MFSSKIFTYLFAVVCLLAFALAQEESAGQDYTITVKTDVYSTEIAYVTLTGEPPVEKPVETTSHSYSVWTSTLSSETGYTTGTPTVFTSHAASYSTTGTASVVVSPTGSPSTPGNATAPIVSSTAVQSAEATGAAASLNISAGLAVSVVVSLLALVM